MTAVFWHALVFGLAPILQKLAGVVLLPLYTHYLSPRDYGEIEILTVVTGLFTVVLKLELRQGIMRAWHAGGEAERGALFRGALQLLGGLGLGLSVSCCFSQWPVRSATGSLARAYPGPTA